ncbi:MAG: hypothetical protein P4L76_14030 [Beijerinckiaceae bacterium]|nr:hypothetical protein [Beijerinckiaceae bacterium]
MVFLFRGRDYSLRGSSSRRLQAAAALVVACVSAPGFALAAGPLDAYLPASGTIKGRVVELRVAPEDQAISKRFQVAVQGNMDWFKNYVKSSKPGEPLPYNAHMGITEAQYTQLLHMKAEFKEKGTVEIKLNRAADGTVSFETSDAAAANLKGTRFLDGEKVAETPFGKLAIFNEIHQGDANAPFGVWNGAEWARVSEDTTQSPSVKVAFGKREPSGEGVFYYQVSPYKDQDEQSLVVLYKLD